MTAEDPSTCMRPEQDKAIILQRKEDIAAWLGGGLQAKDIDMGFLGRLIHHLRSLRSCSCYQMRRDPRVLWFYVHQVHKNGHVIRENAAWLRSKLGLGDEPADQDNNDGNLSAPQLESSGGQVATKEESSESRTVEFGDLFDENPEKQHDDADPA